MRKILCTLCISIMTVAAMLFAQEALNSLENALTSNVFENEFDRQFTPNADFGTYDQHFIYGGLGNPYAGKFYGEVIKSWNDWGTFVFNESNPLMFGYYMPWKMPMSFFIDFGGTAFINRPTAKKKTVWENERRTGNPISVTNTSYYTAPLFNESHFGFQYLIGIGTDMNLVTGVQFSYDPNYSNWEKAYFEKTVHKSYKNPEDSYTEYKKNFDTAPELADAGSFLNMLQHEQKGKKTFIDTFNFAVPVAFSTGSINHLAKLWLNTEIRNNSGSYYYKRDKVEKNLKSSYVKSLVNLIGEYGVEIPAADRDGDSWMVNTSVNFAFRNMENRWSYSHKNNNEVAMKGNYTETQKPTVGFQWKVKGARMLKFASPKKSVRFNMKPTLAFDLVTRRGDADNGYTHLWGYDKKVSSSGTAGTDKIKHSHTVTGDSKQYANQTEFTTEISMPMGLKILPENWKVGFLLGATPTVSHKVIATWNRSGKHKTEKRVQNSSINGTPVSTGFEQGGDQYPSNEYEAGMEGKIHRWSFDERHSIGLTVPFEGGAHLDIRVNGSLLNIEGFGIQAFIPLGSGKKSAE